MGQLARIDGHSHAVTGVALLPAGDGGDVRAASSSRDGTVRLRAHRIGSA
jgi:hypothetical protein